MKSFKYSDHSISRCMYIYPLSNKNVESDYIKSSFGFSKLMNDIRLSDQNKRITIDDPYKHEATSSELSGYFEMDIELNMSWNVLAVTDSDLNPLSIIYDTYILNTREVNYIHLKYSLNYGSGTLVTTLNIGTEYLSHMDEYIGTNMQPIPKLMSRTSEESILNWSDEKFNMSYNSVDSILSDSISFYDYMLKVYKNEDLKFNESSKYILTGTTQDLFIIKIDDLSAKMYPLNYQFTSNSDEPITEIDLGELPTNDILHIELVENGYGIVLVDSSNNIYYNTLNTMSSRPQWEYGSWRSVDNLDDYDILIPTFIDLCGSYIKLPKVLSKTPTSYEVKKWTGLMDESDTYGDRNYQSYYNYPNSTPPGDREFKISYIESLGIQNKNTYFMSASLNQNSPVSMHQFDVVSPTEGNSVILDFNLKLMTSLYVDLFNNGRLNKRVIPRDCGLEIINDSGGNDFITYLGEHYRLPVGAKIMNMSYYIGSRLTSLVTGRYQDFDSNILCGKYGIIITENMIKE